jgi:catechol 2,3-dioxygenase-like lactoylglutathione lyase family enzyme
VNVSNLDRSLEFYEGVTPLRVVGIANAGPQPFTALGLHEGEFRSALLADGSSGQPGVVVHLVEWLRPSPSGVPYQTFFHRGLYRFCFLTSDLDGRYEAALAAGRAPILPPKGHGIPVPGGAEGRTFVLRDPDGIPVQFTRRPSSWRDDLPDQLYHVNIVSGDIDSTRHFLQHVVGLDYVKRLTLPEPVGPIGFGDGADVGQFDAVFLRHRGDHGFAIDVVDWFVPGVTGLPYADATHVGIQRIGLEVDDLDAAVGELEAQGVQLAGPETWELGEAGQRRIAIVEDSEGILYELVQQPPFDGARDTPWPPDAFSETERAVSRPGNADRA